MLAMVVTAATLPGNAGMPWRLEQYWNMLDMFVIAEFDASGDNDTSDRHPENNDANDDTFTTPRKNFRNRVSVTVEPPIASVVMDGPLTAMSSQFTVYAPDGRPASECFCWRSIFVKLPESGVMVTSAGLYPSAMAAPRPASA